MSFLDEIYGDSAMDEAAEAEFLTKVAEDAGFDIDAMDEDQIAYLYEKVAESVADAEGEEDLSDEEEEALAEALEEVIEEEEEAKESGYEDYEQEYEEKIAEADYMGRVMAHSFDDEMEKIARKKARKKGGWAARAGSRVTGHLRGLGEATRGFTGGRPSGVTKSRWAKMSPKKRRALRAATSQARTIARLRKRGVKNLAKAIRRRNLGRGAGVYGLGAAGLAGIGAGIGAGLSRRSKKSSAEEEYIYNRAIEKLAERGWDV